MFLLVSAVLAAAAIIVGRKRTGPRRIMREGRLIKSETVTRDGERFYVEKVAFKDWHVSIPSLNRNGVMRISVTSPFAWKTAPTHSTGKWK